MSWGPSSNGTEMYAKGVDRYLGPAGALNRMLRFWAQLERATAFSPSLAILDKVRAIR